MRVETSIGPLEMQVLGMLDPDAGVSVADIRARLAGQGLDYAYTTVMTVLSRLHKKKMVRREKRGARYLYRSTRRDTQLKRGFFQKVQHALFDDRVKPIAALLEQDLSKAELVQLRQMIDSRLERKK